MSTQDKSFGVGARINELSTGIEKHTNSKRRKHRMIIALGVVLMLASSFVLTRLTLQGRELDADTMTMIGRNEIQKRLPGARRTLEQHLRNQAPQIVTEGYQALVEMIPNFRAFLLKDLNKRIDEMNGEFETRLAAMMSERILASKEQIDSCYPDLSDEEKIERLIADVAQDFSRRYEEAIDSLYADYSQEMARISSTITELRRHPDAEMTEAQRIKKEIIETMVQIMRREKLLHH